jgi:hypothetical protein
MFMLRSLGARETLMELRDCQNCGGCTGEETYFPRDVELPLWLCGLCRQAYASLYGGQPHDLVP